MNGDRKTPANIARQLRKESGFGCCVCGNPIFQYHHIVPYTEEDPHFRPEDMMILCREHHGESHDYKENPTLSIEEQREAKENPFNIKNGHMEGLLKVRTNQVKVGLGLLTLKKGECVDIIKVGQDSAFSLSVGEEDNLEISGNFHNKEGSLLATLEKNNFISEEPFPWDIQFRRQWVKINLKLRDIFLEINTHTSPIEVRANVWYKGSHLIIDKRTFKIATK